MTNEEFFDIGRVAYITGNVQEALAAKQTLEQVVENANNLQETRAEIAALVAECSADAINSNNKKYQWLINRLRILSARKNHEENNNI